jgi:hypothetical protein
MCADTQHVALAAAGLLVCGGRPIGMSTTFSKKPSVPTLELDRAIHAAGPRRI